MKKYRILTLATVLIYITYVAAKNIYSTELIEIVRYFNVSKSDASLATSFCFIGYAVFQLFFIKLIGKINISRYVLIISPVSAALLVAVPFCTQIWQTWIIMGAVGSLLSGIFPACMLVISEYLPDSLVPAANRAMGIGFAVSFALDYFCSSVFIRIADWKTVFYVLPAVYLASALFFCRALSGCERREERGREEQTSAPKDKKKVCVYLLTAGTTGLLINMIYYAVSNWVPNLLNEIFGTSPSLSVLITLLIPLTGAVGAVVCLGICKRLGFVRAAVVLGAGSAAVSVVLSLIYGFSFIVTLLLVVALLFIARGVAHTVGFQVPVESRDITEPARAATVINIFGCVGAAAGPPAYGALIDGSGYGVFFAAAAAAAAVMIVMTVVGRDAVK